MLNGVSARCGGEWEGFGVDMLKLKDAGDTVVASGRYRGIWRVTGRPMNPQVVHIWTMKDGKAVAFQQHVDTLHVARAMGTA